MLLQKSLAGEGVICLITCKDGNGFVFFLRELKTGKIIYGFIKFETRGRTDAL